MTVTLSKRIQEKQFEPIEHFISAKAELMDGTLSEFGDAYTNLANAITRKMDEWTESIDKKENGK